MTSHHFNGIVWCGEKGEPGRASHTVLKCLCGWRGTPKRPETEPLMVMLSEFGDHVAEQAISPRNDLGFPQEDP